MSSRFDNHDIPVLLEEYRVLEETLEAIADALKAKMVADCPVKVDRCYQITADPDDRWSWIGAYKGRRLLVRHIRAERHGLHKPSTWLVVASGVLERPYPDPKRRGQLDGRFTSKYVSVTASRIDLATESEP